MAVEEEKGEGLPSRVIVVGCSAFTTTTEKKVEVEKVEASIDVENKKPLFQRIWSNDDEIAILKGIIQFKSEKRLDPLSVADDFLGFIRNSVHVEVDSTQLTSKVRCLKKRFRNAVKKKRITNPHELKAFELSKRIWEIEGGKMKNKDIDGGGDDPESNLKDEAEREQNIVTQMSKRKLFMEDCGDLGFMKDGVSQSESGEKWKKQHIAEIEVYLKRLELMKEMAEKVMIAINSTS